MAAIDRRYKLQDCCSDRDALRGDRVRRGSCAGRADWRGSDASSGTSCCGGDRRGDDGNPRGGRSAAGSAQWSSRWATAYLSRLERRQAGDIRAARRAKCARPSSPGRPAHREPDQYSRRARSVPADAVPDRLLRPRARTPDDRARCSTVGTSARAATGSDTHTDDNSTTCNTVTFRSHPFRSCSSRTGPSRTRSSRTITVRPGICSRTSAEGSRRGPLCCTDCCRARAASGAAAGAVVDRPPGRAAGRRSDGCGRGIRCGCACPRRDQAARIARDDARLVLTRVCPGSACVSHASGLVAYRRLRFWMERGFGGRRCIDNARHRQG
jgi:hypothetical protein